MRTLPSTQIKAFPFGIYSISSVLSGSIEDGPITGHEYGRSIIITSGSDTFDEKVALVMSSESGIYFGSLYGMSVSEWTWNKLA